MKTKKIDRIISNIIVVVCILIVLACIIIPAITGYSYASKNYYAKENVKVYVEAYKDWIDERRDYDKDFRNYCISIGLLNETTKCDIKKRVMLGENMDYDHGFLFYAENGLRVIYVYNAQTKESKIIVCN